MTNAEWSEERIQHPWICRSCSISLEFGCHACGACVAWVKVLCFMLYWDPHVSYKVRKSLEETRAATSGTRGLDSSILNPITKGDVSWWFEMISMSRAWTPEYKREEGTKSNLIPGYTERVFTERFETRLLLDTLKVFSAHLTPSSWTHPIT